MGPLGRHGRRVVVSRWVLPTAVLAAALLWPAGCSSHGTFGGVPAGTPTIRVLLLENQQHIDISAAAPPVVHIGLLSSGQQLKFTPGAAVPVSLTASGWRIGSATLGSGEMVLEPSDGQLRIGKMTYRGRCRFVPGATSGHFDVINELDLESYLRGVLASELYPSWHEEAYKAQAIVARTYALYESRTDGVGRNFDVFADQRSQVYRGVSGETPRSIEGTQATTGIVVAYGPPGREVIFKAYFSSCCGGLGQSASDAFGDSDIQPLSAQNRGSCCIQSPKFNWGPVLIPKGELTRRMRAWGAWKKQPPKDIGPITRIDIAAINNLGRPIRFIVIDARGMRYSFRGEQLREALNTDAGPGVKLPSSFCKPIDEGLMIRFADGHGYGHGVGMCQWCAQHQAAAGWNDEAIVLDAFRGAKLVRAY